MDQLDSMSEARSILNNSTEMHKSKQPLRWLANWSGEIASKGILKVSYMEEDAYTGWRYKLNLFLWDTFWPIYDKWGTVYILNTHTDDYWESTGTLDPDYNPWHFEDEQTGDGFRLIIKNV